MQKLEVHLQAARAVAEVSANFPLGGTDIAGAVGERNASPTEERMLPYVRRQNLKQAFKHAAPIRISGSGDQRAQCRGIERCCHSAIEQIDDLPMSPGFFERFAYEVARGKIRRIIRPRDRRTQFVVGILIGAGLLNAVSRQWPLRMVRQQGRKAFGLSKCLIKLFFFEKTVDDDLGCPDNIRPFAKLGALSQNRASPRWIARQSEIGAQNARLRRIAEAVGERDGTLVLLGATKERQSQSQRLICIEAARKG